MKCDRDQCKHHHLKSDLNCKRCNSQTVDCIELKENYFEMNLNLVKTITQQKEINGTNVRK